MVAFAALLLGAASGPCLEMEVARDAGEPVAASDVAPVTCPEAPLAGALRYDRVIGANVAAVPLQPGDVIQGASLEAGPTIRRGERLALSSRVGPVVIERPVTALQAARPGDRQIFVRTDDGEILAADLAAEGAKAP